MNTDKDILDAYNDAKEQFSETLEVVGSDAKERFQYSKNKRAQADNSITNVVAFLDHKTGRKYTVSANATVNGEVDDALLVGLQSAISAFLKSAHKHV